MTNVKNFLAVLVLTVFLMPQFASANYFTLPVAGGTITAWFDHDGNSATTMTKYTGDAYSGAEANLDTCADSPYDGSGCYDEHNGTDFATTTGADVLAATDGKASGVYWNDCGGYTAHLWHEDIGYSTLYAHIATTSIASSTAFARGAHLADVDSTGSCAEGAHLHFGVMDGYATSTSNRIDPYGWWDDPSTNPDPNSNKYLWTTYPPSFDLVSTTTGNITSTTTWRGNILIDGNVTVNSGQTLNIFRGTIVKFISTASTLVVNGILDVAGATADKVHLTSYKDDTIGGDTNNDGGATSPAAGNWRDIRVSSTGSTTISNAVVRYGGASGAGFSLSNIYNNGGKLAVANSEVSNGTSYGIQYAGNPGSLFVTDSNIHDADEGIYLIAGTSTIRNSNIHDTNDYGIYSDSVIWLTLTGNTFSNSVNGSFTRTVNNDSTFEHSSNTASGTGKKGFYTTGTLSENRTWEMDGVPYVISGTLTLNSGKTLTINPGAVIKFNSSTSRLNVNGTLDSEGTSTAKIYFTSINDDSVGGDSNGIGTAPEAGNWCEIKLGSTASTTMVHTVIRYGGNHCSGSSDAQLYNNGAISILDNSQVATGTTYGIFSDSLGTTTVTNTEINDNGDTGFYISGAYATTSYSYIHGNALYGMQKTSVASTSAENNYWGGGSSGPYHNVYNPTGTGDRVSNFVDYDPWSTTWP